MGFCLFVKAQQPWDCSGRIFRVLEHDGGSELQELLVQKMTGTLSHRQLAFYKGIRINGIAYHPRQNMIYGVVLGEPYRLCRIDAGGNLEIMKDLLLPTDYLFVSADMSPDEEHLILFGYNEESPNILARIDLRTPDYPTEMIPMQTTDALHPYVYCADIAYHPTTRQLFGFDHLQNRLIVLDPEQGTIDNSSYPVSATSQGNLPSLFFTPQGELFGIGSSNNRYAADRYFFNINTSTGQLIPWENLGNEANQDACACPFTIHLLNRIAQRQVAPCTDVHFNLILINRTDEVLHGIRLVDSFPTGMIIRSISPLPFTGQIIQGPGGRILEVSDVTLPIGRDSFLITVHVQEDAITGPRSNQARLGPLKVPGQTWLDSDDPETLTYGDATQFVIAPVKELFQKEPYHFCAGDTLRLASSVQNAQSYRWSSGDTTSILAVTQPGEYQLTITSGCEELRDIAVVETSSLAITLGEDRIIDRGTSIMLEPTIVSTSPVTSIHWESSLPESLACKTCQVTEVSPWTDTEYRVTIRNHAGCVRTDKLMVRVRELNYYVPNAFSPDGDQVNDVFYLQGPVNYRIETFTVYDRWGNALYEIRDGQCNDPAFGWDGTSNLKPVAPGVYSWQARILTMDGKEIWGFGDVTLVR